MRKSRITSVLIVMLLSFSLNIYASDTLTVESFTDIPSTHWGIDTIRWGLEKKILTGYPNNLFKPNNNVTESEFAVILFKYVESVSTENIVVLEGKHWSQPYYNELEKFQLSLGGYNDDINISTFK
jgi:hypothetical protein